MPLDLIRIYRNEQGLAARQQVIGAIANLSLTMVFAAARVNMDRAQFEWCEKRNGLEVFDLHLARHGNYAELTVRLAHGFIKQGSDDTAVHMPRRPFKAARNTDTRYDAMAAIYKEFEAQTGPVLRPAPKAVMKCAVLERLQVIGGHSYSHAR